MWTVDELKEGDDSQLSCINRIANVFLFGMFGILTVPLGETK